MTTPAPSAPAKAKPTLSLYQLLDPEVLADPYPLYHRLRTEDPVHWDPFLHAWVVTRYADVVRVLHDFQADRTPTPQHLTEMGLSHINPIAAVMVKQMLFMDPPAHTRLRSLASSAFTASRVEGLRSHIQDIADRLIDAIVDSKSMDVIADFAAPLPAIVTAEMLGVPISDHPQLKKWSADFAEMLGNFQHNPDRVKLVLQSLEDMLEYFRATVRELRVHPREGLVNSLLTAEIDGDRLTEEEVIANSIVTMVGGQETTTNLIGNGLLTLIRNPDQMNRLRNDPSLIVSAVEELLRYESPSQHTGRIAPSDVELGGRMIRKRQAVIAVMGAANRDPERFPDPDRLDLSRKDNRHVAFGWAAHFCFGAPLARIEGQIAFETILRRLHDLTLSPIALQWRENLGLRGLKALPITFAANPGVAAVVNMQSPSVEARRSLLESFLDGTLLLRPPERPLVGARSAGHSAPLSCWQLHVWNHTQLAARLSPGAQLFNETITIHRRGPLEVPALEKSFNEILRRHQAWRTTFRVVDGQPQQIVNPPAAIPLLVFDLRNLLEAEQEREVLRLGNEDVRQPFDLQNGPLVRARLLRLSDLEWKLLLTVHQILLDGVSVYNVFLPELMSLYKSFSTGQSSPLPELQVQYPDYAIWERERSQSDVLSRPVAYWRTQLHGPLPQLDLPTDRPRPAQQTFHGAILPFALPRQLSEQVRLYSQRENVTLFIALLAVFYGLLHGYTGQEDIVVGTIAPTRQRSELQALLGYFLNPVVLRADLSGDPTFRELLNRARNLFLEAISYSEAPFDSLVEMLEPQPALDRHPLYQIQISLEPPLPALDEGWNLTPMDFESGGAKLDLYMVFDDRPSGIIGRVQYNPDLFAVSTMSRLVEHYQALLEAVVANPLQHLSELPRFKLTESCMNASIPGASGR